MPIVVTSVGSAPKTLITYSPANSATVTSVSVFRLYSDLARTVLVAQVTPTDNGDGTWAIEVPTPADGTYYASTTVVYSDRPTVEDRDDTLIWRNGLLLPTLVVTVDEVKKHLGQGATGTPPMSARDDDALLSLILAATKPVENMMSGPILPTTLNEVVRDSGPKLRLNKAPVIAVISITNNAGTTFTPYSASNTSGYDTDLESGMVFSPSGFGRRAVVTYTAGYSPVPDTIKHAVLELVAWWWQQRKGGNPSFDNTGQAIGGGGIPGVMTKRMRELLGPYARGMSVG